MSAIEVRQRRQQREVIIKNTKKDFFNKLFIAACDLMV